VVVREKEGWMVVIAMGKGMGLIVNRGVGPEEKRFIREA